MLANTRAAAADLAELNTRPEAIAALDTVTAPGNGEYSLQAQDGTAVETAYFAFTDLFWLDDGTGPRSPHLDSLEELAPGWGETTSLADLARTLRP